MTICSKKYSGYTVRIDRGGHVTLRRPSGAAIAHFGGSRHAPESAAAEWLALYPGSSIDDRRSPRP